MISTAELLDKVPFETRIRTGYRGRLNSYTNLIHWPDGSVSKLNRETIIQGKDMRVNVTLKLHDIGIRNRNYV